MEAYGISLFAIVQTFPPLHVHKSESCRNRQDSGSGHLTDLTGRNF